MKHLAICNAVLAVLYLTACAPESRGKAPAAAASASVKTPENKGWELGKHYVQVAQPERVEADGGRIEIAEVFWYGCSHCYAFEPHLVLWGKSQAKDVHIVRVPALMFEPQRVHARLYYTLQSLGREDLHQSVYDAIHRGGNPLTAEKPEQALELLLSFAKLHGIDADTFKRAYDSDLVAKQTARAEQLMRTYKVEGFPAIIVNGKYLSDGFLAGNQEQLLALAHDLAEGMRE